MKLGAVFVLVAAGGAALAAACSAFRSDATPTPDGLDGSSEAATSDASESDAPSAPDGGRAGFCADAGIHDLCEDFDESPLVKDDWAPGKQSAGAAGLAQLDPGQSTSPPNALLLGLSTVGATSQSTYFLHRNITPTARKTIVLSFDLFVDTLADVDGGVQPDSLVGGIGDGVYNNNVRIAKEAGLIIVGVEEVFPAAYYDPRFTFGDHTFAVGQWHRFVLTSDRQNNTVSLSIDGTVGSPPSKTTFHVPSAPAVNLGLDLGAGSDQFGETIKYYFDNVTVDLDR